MKKLLIYLGLFVFLSLQFFGLAIAQETSDLATGTGSNSEETITDNETSSGTTAPDSLLKDAPIKPLTAIIESQDSVEVSKNIIFDGSKSINPNPSIGLLYEWDFGDGATSEGVEVVHSYSVPGRYTISLTVRDEKSFDQEQVEVFVYNKIMILVTDNVDEQSTIGAIITLAEQQGNYIKLIDSFSSASDFIAEEVLASKLLESYENVKKTEEIIIWSKGSAGLNALSRFLQEVQDSEFSFKDKIILYVTSEEGLANTSQIQRQYSVIKPSNIVIAKESAIYPYIESLNANDFLNTLTTGGYKYEVVNEETGRLRIWNFMSYFVNLLIDSGIPDNTVLLILLLPVIATVIAFMKQVVGLTTFGVYTPTIITLAFWILGFKFGLLTFLIVIGIGSLARLIIARFKLLYIPKMALVLTFVALSIFALIITSVYFELFEVKFVSLAIFPMLIMSTLAEKFVGAQSKKGFLSALMLMGESLLVSLVAFFIIGGKIDLIFTEIQWEFVPRLMLGYPELILVFIIINLILGRWSGLRVFEYIRFREVIKHAEEE